MPPAVPIKPRWASYSFLLYFGGLLVLAAALWLLGVLGDDHGDFAFFLLSVLVLAVVAALAYGLQGRDRPIAAGLFAVVTSLVFGVFFAALLDLIGLLPDDVAEQDGFVFGRFLTEIAVLVAALVLLSRFRFPLLVLVALTTAWVLLADTLTDGGDWLAVLSILIGLLYIGVGAAVDRAYGMWVHLGAGLLILGGLLNFWSESDLDWILILLVGLVYIWVAEGLDRSSYTVLGALAIFGSATHFIEEWFDLPNPLGIVFGGEEVDIDKTGRPLTYAALGLVFMAIGLYLETRRRARAPLEAPPAP